MNTLRFCALISLLAALPAALGAGNDRRWQNVVDPPAEALNVPAAVKLEAIVPFRHGAMTAWPSTPSPFMALADGQGTWQLWALRTGKKTHTLAIAAPHPSAVALSPDGQHLAIFPEPGSPVEVWAIASGKKVQEYSPGERTEILRIAFAGPSRLVALLKTTEAKPKLSWAVAVFDLASGKEACRRPLEFNVAPETLTISPGGRFAAWMMVGGQVRLLDVRQGVEINRLDGPLGRGYADTEGLSFSPDGKELAGMYRDRGRSALMIWDMAGGSVTLSRRLAEDLTFRQAGSGQYTGRALEWFVDRSALLAYGRTVLDRSIEQPLHLPTDRTREGLTGPYRMIDERRMVRSFVDDSALCAELVPIPLAAIAAARKAIAAGGRAVDASLPPGTPADVSTMRKLELNETIPWTYRPDPRPAETQDSAFVPVRLPRESADRLYFSESEAGKVVTVPFAAIRPSIMGEPRRLTRYDLRTGSRDGSLDLPAYSELATISPNGSTVVGRLSNDGDRLDMFSTVNGRHVLGFRPHAHVAGAIEPVAWCGFATPRNLLTLGRSGRLILWSLPECKAVYEVRLGNSRLPFRVEDGETVEFSPGRHILALALGQSICLIDVATGECRGRIEAGADIHRGRGAFSISFRPDGKQLAVLASKGAVQQFTAWDLETGERAATMALPEPASAIRWCSKDALLVFHAESFGPYSGIVSLVEPAKNRVAWNYQLQDGKHVTRGPDNRHWYLCFDKAGPGYVLCSATLPDEHARHVLAASPPAKTAVVPGSKLALAVSIHDAPSSEAGDAMTQELRRHFVGSLGRSQFQIVDDAEITLKVEMKLAVTKTPYRPMNFSIRNVDGKMQIESSGAEVHRDGDRLTIRSQPDAAPTMREERTIETTVAIVDSKGVVVWEQKHSQQVFDTPAGAPAAGDGRSRPSHWNWAVRWCKEIAVPTTVYYNTVHGAIGESLLTADGPQPCVTKQGAGSATGRSESRKE